MFRFLLSAEMLKPTTPTSVHELNPLPEETSEYYPHLGKLLSYDAIFKNKTFFFLSFFFLPFSKISEKREEKEAIIEKLKTQISYKFIIFLLFLFSNNTGNMLIIMFSLKSNPRKLYC